MKRRLSSAQSVISGLLWLASAHPWLFLRVAYSDLKNRVLEGGTDEEILTWCFEKGRRLDETDLMIWNEFNRKLGWNDRATPHLQKLKTRSVLANRDDIVTMVDYFDVDEGRKP
jgi:hypothetical protein